METEWKAIEGHDGYEISVEGVRSYKNARHGLRETPKMMKLWKRKGYLSIRLDEKYYTFHRLLAIAFIPNPENKLLIDHINRNRLDNRLENLRWATRKENNQNKSIQSNNKLGIQHIRKHNKGGFQFRIKRNGIIHQKCFKTLEEAIAYKDEYFKQNQIIE